MVTSDEDLIAITPVCETVATCVACGHTDTLTGEVFFQGIHTLAKVRCRNCQTSFYRTLPAGHDLLFPCSFGENGDGVQCDPSARGWLIRPLIASMFGGQAAAVTIDKAVNETHENAVILNCLDNRFGHSFCKLWNATILKKKYPGYSIIVFVPRALRWLVPYGVAEVWTFDTPLPALGRLITNLDAEVRQRMRRFSRVWLSKAYTHLDIDKVDLRQLLRTSRFDLAQFSALPPVVTFVLREDRLWHGSALEYLLFRVALKLNLSRRMFVWRQNYLVGKTARRISRQIGSVTLQATGIGRIGQLTSCVADHRKDVPDARDEEFWCRCFGRSHLIIGVHGSNMLIPTALSAGFIEILPRHKIRHIAEDTIQNYSSRYTLFLGRHVDQFASTRLVGQHAVSMIRFFPYVYRNAEQTV